MPFNGSIVSLSQKPPFLRPVRFLFVCPFVFLIFPEFGQRFFWSWWSMGIQKCHSASQFCLIVGLTRNFRRYFLEGQFFLK